MCGGDYQIWSEPRQLTKVKGEPIVARTIRLLKDAGVTDIAISSNDSRFEGFGVPVLKSENNWTVYKPGSSKGSWYNGFYKCDEPVCYLMGDVVFSVEAIRTIVKSHTDDIEFFASAPPFSKNYIKPYAEPFGFKVTNLGHFDKALRDIRELDRNHAFKRNPIAWELWQVIKGTPINRIDYTNYTVINDYTCDIDSPKDAEKIEFHVTDTKPDILKPHYMIHAMPKRMWYVEGYLLPRLLEQGIEESQIQVYNDAERKGNLRACMEAFSLCEGDGGTWHLQDDVCICNDFKERTEQHDNGIVCGFSSKMYDGYSEDRIGVVHRTRMWFSFPCIRIPNEWARDCADWAVHYMIGNPVYRKYWENGVNDDWMFRTWLKEFHPDCVALNIAPNLVDHVDWFIGGSSGSKRKEPCRAQYWNGADEIKRLEEWLNGRKKR